MSAAARSAEDLLALQRALLGGVSRTFALTIPALPRALEICVGNAYLLCRVADTIEDACALDAADAGAYCLRFRRVVEGRADAADFARDLAQRLGPRASAAERLLIDAVPSVVAITHGFGPVQRAALDECIAVMAAGMGAFQSKKSRGGLSTLTEHVEYCYVVAGCVGEMLTRLFLDEFPELAPRRAELMALALSFGQTLQMTNILKDFWEDRAQGACWLPRDVFDAEGASLASVRPGHPGFAAGYRRLIGLARAHAENALHYTLAIPPRAPGVRNFCLWALYMALLTQRKLLSRPGFGSGAEVKISRLSVKAVVGGCRLAAESDRALRASFALLARGLPPPRPADLEIRALQADAAAATEVSRAA